MGIPISDTDYQIARTSALKAAAALAGGITYTSADQVLETAAKFEEWLLAPFSKPTPNSSSTGQSASYSPPSTPPSLPDPYSPTTLGTVTSQPTSQPVTPPKGFGVTAQICPACLEAGRSGVVLAKLNPADKGPAKKCSLAKRVKQNGEYVDVGQCSWSEWAN